jgi:catechol 2,3-dioxygenase-like lactoylglutathione lyase family enzyme
MGNDYPSSTVSRRQLMKSLAIGAGIATRATRPVAARSLTGTAINHVSYASADYKKTRDFYVDLFGFQLSEEDDKQLYLWAGDALISAKNTPAVHEPFIDHFGLTVAPWDLHVVEAVLQERGLLARVSRNDPHDTQGKSAFTRDPNGFNLQLGAPDLEVRPAPVATRAPLRAIGVNHISYLCRDYRTTRDFYKDLLGVPVSNDDGGQAYLWFGEAFMAIRNSADVTAKPAIDHVAWTLANWDPGRVSAALKQHSLDVQFDASGKSILTKDVNGYPLELCSHDYGTTLKR